MLRSYTRTGVLLAGLTFAMVFVLADLHVDVWSSLLPVFEWMETTTFGVIGKTWGAAFAVVEAFHLLGMVLLGGAVLVMDARLLGLFLADIPVERILKHGDRLFFIGLGVAILTGVFMACGVAIRIYYLPVYWYKMLALLIGIVFVVFIKRPLMARGMDNLSPLVVRLTAVSSLMIWFTVAATGRWIGYSG